MALRVFGTIAIFGPGAPGIDGPEELKRRMKRRRLGLVGCGNWGRHILRDLVSLGCDVTAVARSEPSRARAAQGGARAIVSHVVDLPNVDGVVIATPTAIHAETIDSLLDRDVPLFVEKPLCSDPVSADRLARTSAGRIFVMDKWRYHPGVEVLAEIARTGELGPVVGLRTTRVGWGNPHTDTDGTWILAPHDLAIALEILGEIPRPRCSLAHRVGGEPVGLYGFLGNEPWMVLEVSTRSPVYRREIQLQCRDGVAALDDGYSQHVQIVRNHDASPRASVVPELREISPELPLLRELRAFVGYLDGGPPPRSSVTEGAAIVRCIAAMRSLAGIDEAE